MKTLELLSPARTAGIGIDAIDAGADAVYIAGPQFGARKAAGNSIDDIAVLCRYAHRFGAAVFVTVNIEIEDGEIEELHREMLLEQEAGVDAFIIRDPRIAAWKDITRPLHASTQCAIRSIAAASAYERLGCSRIVLERQLPIERIRQIRDTAGCELEFFVHGAICTGYSGECRLSEYLNGRSADRGECIQACRSNYDLVDGRGRTIIRDKALLSLKDYNLKDHLEELADAGVCSFKIEGRLKNSAYVRNVVKEYSEALDKLIASRPGEFRRASRGRVRGGFIPDSGRTFNRGYTSLFIQGRRGRAWSSMDAPKPVGVEVGKISAVHRCGQGEAELKINGAKDIVLHNGDGFSFISADGITGFRGDVCSGNSIRCKFVEGLREGLTLYRNADSSFEKEMARNPGKRILEVKTDIEILDGYLVRADAVCEDGRRASVTMEAGDVRAENSGRMEALIRAQLSKTTEELEFSIGKLEINSSDGSVPLASAAALNGIRRELAGIILSATAHTQQCRTIAEKVDETIAEIRRENRDRSQRTGRELLRSKYCIRYELGICPVHHKAADSGKLYLLNNGQRLPLEFDCRNCEMTVLRPEQLTQGQN